MNDKYIPCTNHVTSSNLTIGLVNQKGTKETYLESKAIGYLEDVWTVREVNLKASGRTFSQHDTYVTDSNEHSHIYHVGNLCIANLYYPFLKKTNGQFINFYQLPWKPYYDIYYSYNTPTTDANEFATVIIKVSKDTGILSLALYYDGSNSGVFDVGANFIFPLSTAIG